MNQESKQLIIIGAGGHARVLIEALRRMGHSILCLTDQQRNKHGQRIMGVEIRGSDDLILETAREQVLLVNGVGSVDRPELRSNIYKQWKQRRYHFATIIHPTAIVSPEARLEEGAQVLAGAIIQVGTTIEENVIVNTGAQVDHDCHIGTDTQIAPGCVLCGNVSVGQQCHVGAGATVIQGVKIGDQSVVGAGAVVIHDVPGHTKVVGIPARPIST